MGLEEHFARQKSKSRSASALRSVSASKATLPDRESTISAFSCSLLAEKSSAERCLQLLVLHCWPKSW